MLLRHAQNVFLRYGIKRTSMADIAEEAGISRQTLYKTFSNKDDVMLAMMRHHFSEKAAAMAAGIAATDNVSTQIDVIVRAVVIAPREALSLSPHAAEIMDGIGKLSERELARAAEETRGIFKQVFAPYVTELEGKGMTPAGLASFAQLACKSIKGGATSKAEMLELIATFKAVVLTALGRG